MVDCKRLIYKESNRFNEIINILKRFNVSVENDSSNIYIECSNPKIKEDEIINVAKDHRIIMLSILLAIKSNTRLIIEDVSPVNKSYPLFIEDLKKIGANIKYLD